MSLIYDIMENIDFNEYTLELCKSVEMISKTEIAQLVSEVTFEDITLKEQESITGLDTTDGQELISSLHYIPKAENYNLKAPGDIQNGSLQLGESVMSPPNSEYDNFKYNTSPTHIHNSHSPLHYVELNTPVLEGKRSKGPKRYRTIFKEEQVQRLEDVFKNSKFPPKKVRTALVNDLALSESTIVVWFQNRRMKEKKKKQASEVETDIFRFMTTKQCYQSLSYKQMCGGNCIVG